MATNSAGHCRDVVDTLFGYLQAQGDTSYLGESVSQLEHSLQAAALATSSGADESLVLAALLHDVGRFLPSSAKLPIMKDADGKSIGTASHDSVGERYLHDIGFPRRVYEVVGAHVWAKRFLCATEEGYWDALSKTSKSTLVPQGGPFPPDQVAEAKNDPLLNAKLSVRRWDDLAKKPGVAVPDLNSYYDMALRSLRHTLDNE